jgi:hypothetical protein
MDRTIEEKSIPMHRLLRFAPAALVLVCLACSSTPVRIETLPISPGEEVIGPAEGASTGLMLFQFIPINQNKRFEKAFQNALENSGGTRLVDVTIQENWFWAYVLNGYRFKVTGTAVRPRQ